MKRKRNCKKVFAAGLIVWMLAGAVSGCGDTQSGKASESDTTAVSQSQEEVKETDPRALVKYEGLPIVEEEQTLSVLTMSAYPEVEPEDLVLWQQIKEATNVNVEWEVIPSTAWLEKKGLVLSRTELPDILEGDNMFNDNDFLTMIDAGQLIPLDDLLDYAPNFKKVLEEQPEMRAAITATDGHIYAIPQWIGVDMSTNEYDCSTGNVTYINKTWLDNLGLPIPTTVDELKDVLIAFKTQDPNGNGIADEIPVTTYSGNSYFDLWFGYHGLLVRSGCLPNLCLNVEGGKVIFSAEDSRYRDALDYWHELWELGVCDPETFTQDASMFSAKLMSETRVAGMFSCWRGTSWRLSDDDDEYVILPALDSDNGKGLYSQRFSGLSVRCGAAITKDCENPELAMRWLDNMVEPKNAYSFLSKGTFGYNYEDNGDVYSVIKAVDLQDPEQLINGGLLGFTCMSYITYNKGERSTDPLNVNNEKAVSDAIYRESYPEEYYPNVFLTISENEIIAEKQTDLKTYMDEFYADWIVNGGDDAKWEAHLEQLKALGVDVYKEQFQIALDRYNEAQ